MITTLAALSLGLVLASAPPASGSTAESPPGPSLNRKLAIAGGVLVGLGAAGIGVAIGGNRMAQSATMRLRELSSNSTVTGFPVGDYACRNVPASECPPTQIARWQSGRAMWTYGMLAGTVTLTSGAVLLIVAAARGSKQSPPPTDEPSNVGVPITMVTPVWLPGGGGLSLSVRF